MLLTVLYLALVWAFMPFTSLAFPTSPNGVGKSPTVSDQLLRRGEAPHSRAIKSIAYVGQGKIALIPTSIDPTDNTPVYTLSNSTMQAPSNVLGTLTRPVGNGVSGPGGPDSFINFKWGIGHLVIDGRIDTDTLDTDITIWIYGINIGKSHGNLVEGVAMEINLRFVKGQIKLYIQNKDEVWLHVSLAFSFGKKLEKDVKIFKLPGDEGLSIPHAPAQAMPPATSTNATNGTATA